MLELLKVESPKALVNRYCSSTMGVPESLSIKTVQLPSGKHTNSYWKWPFIVDFPIKNGDCKHTNSYWKWPFTVYIVDFPIQNGGSFHSKLLNYQRVHTITASRNCIHGGLWQLIQPGKMPMKDCSPQWCVVGVTSKFAVSWWFYMCVYIYIEIDIHTHRIHGAAIYGNIYHQYTPVMLAYIPAPWILWDIQSQSAILFGCILWVKPCPQHL